MTSARAPRERQWEYTYDDGAWLIFTKADGWATHRFWSHGGESKARWLCDTLNAITTPAPAPPADALREALEKMFSGRGVGFDRDGDAFVYIQSELEADLKNVYREYAKWK